MVGLRLSLLGLFILSLGACASTPVKVELPPVSAHISASETLKLKASNVLQRNVESAGLKADVHGNKSYNMTQGPKKARISGQIT